MSNVTKKRRRKGSGSLCVRRAVEPLAKVAAVGGGEVGKATVEDGGENSSVSSMPHWHYVDVGKTIVREGAGKRLDTINDGTTMGHVGISWVSGEHV